MLKLYFLLGISAVIAHNEYGVSFRAQNFEKTVKNIDILSHQREKRLVTGYFVPQNNTRPHKTWGDRNITHEFRYTEPTHRGNGFENLTRVTQNYTLPSNNNGVIYPGQPGYVAPPNNNSGLSGGFILKPYGGISNVSTQNYTVIPGVNYNLNLTRPGYPNNYSNINVMPPKNDNTTLKPITPGHIPYPGYGTGYPSYPAPNSVYPAPYNGYQGPNTVYPVPNNGFPASNNGYQVVPVYPAPTNGVPANNSYPRPSFYPDPNTVYPRPSVYPVPTTGIPATNNGYQPANTYPAQQNGVPTNNTYPRPSFYPDPNTVYPNNGYQRPNTYPVPNTGIPAPNNTNQRPNNGYQNQNTGYQNPNTGSNSTVSLTNCKCSYPRQNSTVTKEDRAMDACMISCNNCPSGMRMTNFGVCVKDEDSDY